MNTEKINPLEQHVEKIVLAVAAAGALYLGYLAMQPITIEHQGREVRANEIETTLSQQLAAMEATKSQNAQVTPVVKLDNYLQRYKDLVKNQPLDPKLFAGVPSFGPANAAVGEPTVGPGDVEKTYRLALPAPAAPEFVAAEVRQQPVAAIPPGAAVPAVGQGETLPTKDITAVLVQGYLPIGKMRAEMAAIRDPKERLPDDTNMNLRQAVVYRVDVRRRERTSSGWSQWQMVEPAKTSLPPTEYDWGAMLPDDGQPRRLGDIDLEFKQIVLPDWHLDATGQPILPSILTKPVPAEVTRRMKALQDEETRANGGTPVTAAPAAVNPVAPRPQPGMTAARRAALAEVGMDPDIDGGLVAGEIPGQPGAAAPNMMSADVATLKAQPLVPFAFWDETVEAGKEYQYEVRARYVNPAFNFRHGLKDERQAKLATLDSAWVPVPGAVTVNADVAFFAMSGAGRGGSSASFRLYKLTQGRWYQTSAEVQPGMPVAGTVTLRDKPPPAPQVAVDTGWKVVDVTPDGRVVLINGSGQMMTREVSSDRDDPNNRKLEGASKWTPPAVVGPDGQEVPANRGRAAQPTPPPARGGQQQPTGMENWVDPRSRMGR